jgi:sulfur carrier protein ThiS
MKKLFNQIKELVQQYFSRHDEVTVKYNFQPLPSYWEMNAGNNLKDIYKNK